MPGPTNKRINFGDILQAIEDQLLADHVVENESQVTWIVGNSAAVPQFTGEFDILLRARNAVQVSRDGGSHDKRFRRYVDLYIRSQHITEPGASHKKWCGEQFAKSDAVINSVGNDEFWPEDPLQNLLTIEPIRAVGDAPPEKNDHASAWGDSVCTLEVIYYPLVEPVIPEL